MVWCQGAVLSCPVSASYETSGESVFEKKECMAKLAPGKEKSSVWNIITDGFFQKQNSDISWQNSDNYYSCTFIFCTIYSSKIIFLRGINNEVKRRLSFR